ncbi:hypothetical protein ACOMHN_021699 [Nucella lapillus]
MADCGIEEHTLKIEAEEVVKEVAFAVVGHQYNSVEEESRASRHYETIYSLLDSLSPGYRNSFSETLTAKLQRLQPEVQDEESMDTK